MTYRSTAFRHYLMPFLPALGALAACALGDAESAEGKRAELIEVAEEPVKAVRVKPPSAPAPRQAVRPKRAQGLTDCVRQSHFVYTPNLYAQVYGISAPTSVTEADSCMEFSPGGVTLRVATTTQAGMEDDSVVRMTQTLSELPAAERRAVFEALGGLHKELRQVAEFAEDSIYVGSFGGEDFCLTTYLSERTSASYCAEGESPDTGNCLARGPRSFWDLVCYRPSLGADAWHFIDGAGISKRGAGGAGACSGAASACSVSLSEPLAR